MMALDHIAGTALTFSCPIISVAEPIFPIRHQSLIYNPAILTMYGLVYAPEFALVIRFASQAYTAQLDPVQ